MGRNRWEVGGERSESGGNIKGFGRSAGADGKNQHFQTQEVGGTTGRTHRPDNLVVARRAEGGGPPKRLGKRVGSKTGDLARALGSARPGPGGSPAHRPVPALDLSQCLAEGPEEFYKFHRHTKKEIANQLLSPTLCAPPKAAPSRLRKLARPQPAGGSERARFRYRPCPGTRCGVCVGDRA